MLFGLLIILVTIILFFILCVRLLISVIKKKPLPKKLMYTTLAGAIVFSLIYIYESYFFTFDEIERESMQEGFGPVISPTKKYTANAYYEPWGGVLGGVNVWIEITYHNEKNKVKTIYYSDSKSSVYLNWKDEDTLFIQNEDPSYPNENRSIELDVETEIYDESGLACQSLIMKDDYERCYQD